LEVIEIVLFGRRFRDEQSLTELGLEVTIWKNDRKYWRLKKE